MLQRFLTFVSLMPRLWNGLRWLAEAGYRSHYRAIDRVLEPRRGTSRRFLDLGCGTGQFAASFPADRYLGVDPTRPYIAFAGEHRPGQFSVMDGSALGLAAHSFDGALVLGVFHHLSDEIVRSSMVELHHALKPDAKLLVIEDVPPPSLWNVPGHIMHWLDRGEHIRTDAEYRSLFAPHFEVREAFGMRSGICDYGVYVLGHRSEVQAR